MQDAALSKVTRKVALNFTRVSSHAADLVQKFLQLLHGLAEIFVLGETTPVRGMGWNRNFYNKSSVCEYSQTHVWEDFALRI